MAIVGFVLLSALGLWLFVGGFVAMLAASALSGRVQWLVVVVPLLGAVLLFAAYYWSPIFITIAEVQP